MYVAPKGGRRNPLKCKRLFFSLIVTLVITFYDHPPLLSTPKVQFSIIYTNDVMGEVEPCG
jgi:hypothetical protein